jgi:hypothetical protein
MRWCFAVLLLAACRTPPLDFDGGAPPPPVGAIDMAHAPRDLAVAVPPDLAMPSPTSCCSTPGNPGNELGVGKYCDQLSDCAGQPANLCATLGDPSAHFCTRACTPGQSDCGSGATCQCAGQQCACIPGECLMPPPGC